MPKLAVLARRRCSGVASVPEGVDHVGVPADGGHQAQLYLGVVGRDDDPPRLRGYECLADLPAHLGADRDVLQVGVGRTQSSGSGKSLVECRMYPSVPRVDEGGEGLDVGRDDLLDGPELQDVPDDRMTVLQCRKGLLVSGIVAFLVLAGLGVQLHPVEEHGSELDGGWSPRGCGPR